MLFKNLTIFALQPGFEMPTIADDDLVALKEPGPLEMESRGFIPPYGNGSDAMSITMGGGRLVTVGSRKRALPMAAVRAELEKLLDDSEKLTGARPGGRARKLLHSQVLERMLPNAPVVPGRVDAILLDNGFLLVDTASRATAEMVVGELRRALGSFPALPLAAAKDPSAVLRRLLTTYDPVFRHGQSVELRQAVANGEVVKITNGQLDSDEVMAHVRAGLQVTRLEVVTERMVLTIGDDLVLRKLHYLDVVLDQLESQERDDIKAELDARLAILVPELQTLLGQVLGEFCVA